MDNALYRRRMVEAGLAARVGGTYRMTELGEPVWLVERSIERRHLQSGTRRGLETVAGHSHDSMLTNELIKTALILPVSAAPAHG